MVSADAALKALAAVVGMAFAATILAGGGRARANGWLALFLALIAGNQAAEAARAFATTEEARLVWYKVATVFAAFDPAVLATFVSAQPSLQRLRHPLVQAPVWTGALLLAIWGLLLDAPAYSVSAFTLGLVGFTYVCYGGLTLALVRDVLRGPGTRGERLLVPAMLVVFFPTVLHVTELGVGAWSLERHGRAGIGTLAVTNAVDLVVLPALTLALAYMASGPNVDPKTRRIVLASALAACAVTLLLRSFNYAVVLGHWLGWPVRPELQTLGRSGAAIRWLVFGAFVSMATLKHDLLGMSLSARRRAGRVLVGLVVLSAGATLLMLVSTLAAPQPLDVRPIDLLILSAAILLSQGFRSLVDRVAHKAYGVPLPTDEHARREAYRLAAVQATGEGVPLDRNPRLARLREELGIDVPTAATLERLAEEAAAGPLSEGQLVAGRYRVQHLVGMGSASRVFLAHDERLDRPVALKEVPHAPEGEDAPMMREARRAGSMQHPNVLVVHDVLQRRGMTVLVTEHAEGGSLAKRLKAGPPFTHKDASRVLEQVLEGLAAVHARGVVHRDLKPANVLLSGTGTPKLADFGLARQSDSTVDANEALLGTPEFMAPEQRRGQPATAQSDLYAAGLIGERLFGPAPPPRVAEVLSRATRPAPEDRWASADEMLAALREAQAQ